MKKTEKAYLAGIIDGEGTYSLARRPDGRTQFRIRVVNQDIQLMDWLEEKTGGSVFKTGKAACQRPCSLNHIHKNRQTYVWQVVGLRALIILNNIWPYVLVKRGQAEEPMKWRPKNTRGRTEVIADLQERGWNVDEQ